MEKVENFILLLTEHAEIEDKKSVKQKIMIVKRRWRMKYGKKNFFNQTL
jgi:hypothetical protein